MPQPPGALPRYQQISETLIREIAAGRLVEGERLPPERAMAADHGVAVGTLRKALADLAERGVVDRRQGSGNYIRARAEVRSVYSMFRLELHRGGGLPTAEVLAVDRLAKPPSLPAFGRAAEGHRIRRLRRVGGEAVAVEEIWLDGTFAPRITAAELPDSLYLFYRLRFGLHIARAEDRVGVGPVPDWAPAAFGLAPGAVAGHVVRLSYAPDGEAVEASHTWFDPARASYVARLR